MITKIWIAFYGLLALCATLPELKADEEKVCFPGECYAVKEVLGAGAFGEVLKVEDSEGKKFALKVYHNSNSPSSDSTLDFWAMLNLVEREFQRGQELNHPNIIKSLDYYRIETAEQERTDYLLLQLVEGKTIYNCQPRGLPAKNARRAASDFVSALRHAFARDLIHLDLHGNNVMIDNRNKIKVIDLASFFSVEEINHFARKKLVAGEAIDKKGLEEAIGPHEKKLKNFFNGHADLREVFINSLQYQHKDAHNMAPMPIRRLNALYDSYFKDISKMCLKIIALSDMPRKEMESLAAKNDKLIQKCDGEASEKELLDIDNYFRQLQRIMLNK